MRFDPLTGETDVLYEGTNNGNGLLWTEAGQLLCCESGARRISLISFTENRADTIVDNFEGKLLNSPNDLVMDGQPVGSRTVTIRHIPPEEGIAGPSRMISSHMDLDVMVAGQRYALISRTSARATSRSALSSIRSSAAEASA